MCVCVCVCKRPQEDELHLKCTSIISFPCHSLKFYLPTSNLPLQVELCQQCIEWARGENRVFLRQALEARLTALYVDTQSYTSALAIGTLGRREGGREGLKEGA